MAFNFFLALKALLIAVKDRQIAPFDITTIYLDMATQILFSAKFRMFINILQFDVC